MTKAPKKKIFRRLIFMLLVVVLAAAGVILWRLPRRGWSPEASEDTAGKVVFSGDKEIRNVVLTSIDTKLLDLILEHKYAEAKKIARELIEQRPMYWGPIMVSLAQILAVHPDGDVRDGGEAVFIAEHAAGLTEYRDAGNLDVLAMAYAEAGDFDRAAITAEMAFKYAWLVNAKDYANEIRERVELYRQKKTFRIPDLK